MLKETDLRTRGPRDVTGLNTRVPWEPGGGGNNAARLGVRTLDREEERSERRVGMFRSKGRA